MFGDLLFTKNVFVATFERQERVRRLGNDLEDRLEALYKQPQMLPVPDEMDAKIPRFIFESKGGFSRIAVSQVDVKFDVKYSDDYQKSRELRDAYLIERVGLVYDVLDILERSSIEYQGLTTEVLMPSDSLDADLLEHLSQTLLRETVAEPNQYLIKYVSIADDIYYEHVAVGNYRAREVQDGELLSFSDADATSRGIRIETDVNDRYAFNEGCEYSPSRESGLSMIGRAEEMIAEWAEKVGG